jgi:hypothetical protein
MKTTEVEARYDNNYGYVLVKDGREAFCPYQQPIPTQGIGGMGLMRLPCSTLCPQARIKINSEFIDGILTEQAHYEVGCSKTEYKISNPYLKIVGDEK